MDEKEIKTLITPEMLDSSFKEECEELQIDTPMTVIRNFSYRFIPEEKGTYQISSGGSTGEWDLHGYLFNSKKELVGENDNFGEDDFNFSILCELEEGETYYLVISVNGKAGSAVENKIGGYQVTVTLPPQDEIVIGETTAGLQRETAEGVTAETDRSKATEAAEETDGGAATEISAETEESAATETTAETDGSKTTETAAKMTEGAAEETMTEKNEGASSEKAVETAGGAAAETEEIEGSETTEEITESETGTQSGKAGGAGQTETEEKAPAIDIVLNPETEDAIEPATERITEHPGITGGMGNVLEIGAGFAAGLAAALVIGCLTGIGRKRKIENRRIEDRRQEENGKPVVPVSPVSPEPPKVSRIGKAHGIGKRKDQQDSFFVSDLRDLKTAAAGDMMAVVADGIGGLKNGAVISTNVVRSCTETFYQNIGIMEPGDVILKMARCVKEEVGRLQNSPGESGSTMVIAIIWKGVLYFLTIGDSRIWLWRNGGLIRLNREHIYQEELALKVINCQDGLQSTKADPQRKLVTSFVGQGVIKYMDRNSEGIVLQKGDKILLASDGVFGTIDERSMERMLHQTAENAARSMQEAVENKNRAGQDNYTAVVLEYQG